MFSLGIDLGGTNIAVAVVSPSYEILYRKVVKTPSILGDSLPHNVATAMADCAISLLKEHRLRIEDATSIGIGSPGTINPATQTIGYWSNLNFKNVPMGQLFSSALKVHTSYVPPIYMENDANSAAYGEFMAGAGKKADSIVAITLGTGVGGGAVFQGKLLTGYNYAGLEVGHFVLKEGGAPCTCGRLGCFEAYASATALVGQTKSAMHQNKESLLWEVVKQDIACVNGKTVFDAAALGDNVAKDVVFNYIRFLGSGVTSLINLLQPEVLCIGGGIAGQQDKLLKPLLEIVNKEDYARNLDTRCRVVLAELGNDAGIIGAACLGTL